VRLPDTNGLPSWSFRVSAQVVLNYAIQGWRLKAHLFTLKLRFEEAEKAYETALHYINRETNPQLWAETEVDVGITHRELGIRVEERRATNIWRPPLPPTEAPWKFTPASSCRRTGPRPRTTWVPPSGTRRLGPRGHKARSF
jgi:hypothetical protein